MLIPYIFLIPPIDGYPATNVNKKFCHHKVLASFQIKSPHYNGSGSTNHVHSNYFHI